MRCQSLRSTISLGRYVFELEVLHFIGVYFFHLMLIGVTFLNWDYRPQDNKDVWKLVLGKHNLTSPISSYSRPEVITKSQTYFFTHTVKSIAVTSTAKGITSKQLLIGTIGDQVRSNKNMCACCVFVFSCLLCTVSVVWIPYAVMYLGHFFVLVLNTACILQVLALDKRFLDPRRTVNPTQAEKEEGIIPLTDSLPIMPQVH